MSRPADCSQKLPASAIHKGAAGETARGASVSHLHHQCKPGAWVGVCRYLTAVRAGAQVSELHPLRGCLKQADEGDQLEMAVDFVHCFRDYTCTGNLFSNTETCRGSS